LWARHGENVANVTRTFSHRVYDGDLTDTGRRQAEELAGRLARCDGDLVGHLVCSPLRRARQTAEIVGAGLGLPVVAEIEDLRELNVGALDGRNDLQSWDTYTRVLAAWKAGQTQARFPGGEDCGELCARLRHALTAVARSSAGRRSLIVAHGANLRAALPSLTGEPDPGTDLPTGAVAALNVDPVRRPRAAVQLLNWPS
jgi:probable phosphoglycerate mutase